MWQELGKITTPYLLPKKFLKTLELGRIQNHKVKVTLRPSDNARVFRDRRSESVWNKTEHYQSYKISQNFLVNFK